MNFYPIDNYIDGVAFVSLTLPEIREMVPPIGLAKKIVKLIPKVYVCTLTCLCISAIFFSHCNFDCFSTKSTSNLRWCTLIQ